MALMRVRGTKGSRNRSSKTVSVDAWLALLASDSLDDQESLIHGTTRNPIIHSFTAPRLTSLPTPSSPPLFRLPPGPAAQGLSIVDYHGNFHRRLPGEIYLPAVSASVQWRLPQNLVTADCLSLKGLCKCPSHVGSTFRVREVPSLHALCIVALSCDLQPRCLPVFSLAAYSTRLSRRLENQ